MGEFQGEVEAARGGVQNFQGFRDSFLADAVTGDDGDLVRGSHASFLLQFTWSWNR